MPPVAVSCMCGEGCEICKMAKFRAGRATKNVAGIEGSEQVKASDSGR